VESGRRGILASTVSDSPTQEYVNDLAHGHENEFSYLDEDWKRVRVRGSVVVKALCYEPEQ
jgi:hypothetical protein